MVLVPNLIVPMPTWHYLITSRPPSKSRYLFSDKIVMACPSVLTSWWAIWWCSIMFEKLGTRKGQMMRIVNGNIDEFGMGDGFGMFLMVMIMTMMVMMICGTNISQTNGLQPVVPHIVFCVTWWCGTVLSTQAIWIPEKMKIRKTWTRAKLQCNCQKQS